MKMELTAAAAALVLAGCATRSDFAMEPVPADANTLTAEEVTEGWTLLWDGKSRPDQWVGDKDGFSRFPTKGWKWGHGELWMIPSRYIDEEKCRRFPLPPEQAKLGDGGCIQTKKFFRDFHFKVDFKLTRAANSGIKYFYDETQNENSCEEFQLISEGSPDFVKGGPTHRVGALYDLIATPLADKVVRPIGQWNTAEVISKGRHVEHWLNGVKILEYERGGAVFRAAVAKSKYAKWGKDRQGHPQPWGELKEGRIQLQDHTDGIVYFCNIKVREL